MTQVDDYKLDRIEMIIKDIAWLEGEIKSLPEHTSGRFHTSTTEAATHLSSAISQLNWVIRFKTGDYKITYGTDHASTKYNEYHN
tara:strand:+ start:643 stop:897 length:255 start_codon:yes stop_codon:yes gene_type:complete